MTTTINNTLKQILIDTENAQIILSKASLELNEAHNVSHTRRSMRTVAEMEGGKFRRMFNRHRTAFRFFN